MFMPDLYWYELQAISSSFETGGSIKRLGDILLSFSPVFLLADVMKQVMKTTIATAVASSMIANPISVSLPGAGGYGGIDGGGGGTGLFVLIWKERDRDRDRETERVFWVLQCLLLHFRGAAKSSYVYPFDLHIRGRTGVCLFLIGNELWQKNTKLMNTEKTKTEFFVLMNRFTMEWESDA